LKTAVIIPAYNEAATISRIVAEVKPYVNIVIVVDDASIDETGELASYQGAIVVKHLCNQGYDSALQTGFEKADNLNVEVVVTFDADGQHEANIVRSFIEPIVYKDVDIVLGVRRKTARFSEDLFNYYVRIRYGINDLLCGLKAYNMNVYRKHGCFDSSNSIGTELALFGLYNNLPVATVVIDVNENIRKSKFGSTISANIKIIKALINALFRDIQNNYK
jgi:glycosyltransferase involved in cell wall biosynthesis